MSEAEGRAVLVIALILVVIFTTWVLAWRARRRRQGGLRAPTVPAELSAPRAEHRVLSLATTPSAKPLERIVAPGLALRSAAVLSVHDTGLVLTFAGKDEPVYIPTERLHGVGHAEWALDRGSGGGRIVLVRWVIGDGDQSVEVDTALRGDDPVALVADIQALLPAELLSTTPDPSGASE